MFNRAKQYINGEWVNSTSNESVEVINPATEEVLGKIAKGTREDVDKAVEAAHAVYLEFRNTSVEYRKELLQKILEEYKKRKDDLIDAMTAELGAPLQLSEKTHYQAGINHFEGAIDGIEKVVFEERRGEALVVKEAVGVSGLITPWNFPTNQTCIKLAAAFAAGCPVVLKPSSETPFAAIILAEIFEAAGVPKGYFNLVTGSGSVVGDAISSHPKIRKVSFTGSGAAGKLIMKNAADSFKKISLELGGKSPLIILDDVDIEEAAEAALTKIMNNSGQVCTAASRTLIPEHLKEEFEAAVLKKLPEFTVGNPREEGIRVGPLVSKEQFDTVQGYILKGQDEAKLIAGGLGKPEGLDKGYFVKPTVFTDVKNNMTIAQEEIFGPVMTILTYKDLDEAIEIANDVEFGLAGYIIGNDKEVIRKLARNIESGVVSLNDGVRTNDLPFGGYKSSGIGREWGDFGIEEYLEVKSIPGYFTE
ncbi:MAG TPA: aldehyde dehydrogenase family protein [Aliicoccus persicus]|uniref:aldehyde dehydrogenase (NAD(+)) n=1 Tax=Aliicoccus persicus TaxID=930138 RepID=A0A921B609_9STAP|nr:aldehyde dehydrogenase family protein [Aliicoccus persicus]